jgi:hypothetical protein
MALLRGRNRRVNQVLSLAVTILIFKRNSLLQFAAAPARPRKT